MKLLPDYWPGKKRSADAGASLLNERGRGRGRSSTVILALAMLVLIIAQLSWWLIFFQRNQAEAAALQRQLDRLRIAGANGELAPSFSGRGEGRDLKAYEEHITDQSPLVLFANGRYGLDPAEIARRESQNQRAMFMLISETIFVILVCSYGSFRVIRTILRERRLGHERQIFIDSVTHELKTPLASILLNLQTILKRNPPESAREELIQDSIEDVRRLEEQLNNILLSSRLGQRNRSDSDGATIHENTEAVGAIHAFFQENAKRFDQAGLQASFDLPEELRLRIDLDSFRTILSNLLQNTIQYAGTEAPRIHVSASSTERGRAVLSFQDTGPGIPRAERENVFQPFYRLNEGQRPVRGSGMGLYLVRELSRGAGGDVRIVDSGETDSQTNAAAGAAIEVRLPLAKD